MQSYYYGSTVFINATMISVCGINLFWSSLLILTYNVVVTVTMRTSFHSKLTSEYIVTIIFISVTFTPVMHSIIQDSKISYLTYQKLQRTLKQK